MMSLRGLLAVVAGLLAVAAGEAVFLLASGPQASTERPVVVGDLAARSVVDLAAQDLTEIASTSYRNYDEQVEQATTLMTPEFAETYRGTARSLAQTFQEQQREVSAQVVASAVVRASDSRVEALVFLDSTVTERGRDVRVPYRTLVTMTRVDHGWLVADILTE